ALARLRGEFGVGHAARKRLLVLQVLSGTLTSAGEIVAFHELLCFMAAYPDDDALAALARLSLLGFLSHFATALVRHRVALTNSGIRGTAIEFRFFAPTARWLAERWPERLRVVWDEFENDERLAALLPLFAHAAESPALDEYDFGGRGWIDRMRGSHTDATFLIDAFGRLAASETVREIEWDTLDVPIRLEPGPGTPNRTVAGIVTAPLHFQSEPLARSRPDLARALREPPHALRMLPASEGRRYIDLAREAMVARERDLDAFAYGNPRDVRLVDYPDGLQFACIGVVPERRLLLEAVYGYLTLKNGIPIGYVLTSALYGSSEIAYNVFETWRGVDAAAVYARVLAMTRLIFGSTTFTIYPYQLGDGNDEALASGAWWFYYKLGFRPRDAATRRRVAIETERMKRRPGHRSSRATLASLARENLYWQPGAERDDVIGRLPLANVGLAVTKFLAGDRDVHAHAARAAVRLGVRSLRGASPSERMAWERWAPLICVLPGLERWSTTERRALIEVVRAKGGECESEFVRRFDSHRRLRAAIARMARSHIPD
ncbi:MAG: hypothetical protein HOP12_02410, partial [Candidatus Eisenbacteria bacterium]|nr:hypothetical protein [Candidatus Eisenbacteria bacterium]